MWDDVYPTDQMWIDWTEHNAHADGIDRELVDGQLVDGQWDDEPEDEW